MESLVECVIEFYEYKYSESNYIILAKIKASYLKVFELFDSMKILKTMLENIVYFIQDKDILKKITV